MLNPQIERKPGIATWEEKLNMQADQALLTKLALANLIAVSLLRRTYLQLRCFLGRVLVSRRAIAIEDSAQLIARVAKAYEVQVVWVEDCAARLTDSRKSQLEVHTTDTHVRLSPRDWGSHLIVVADMATAGSKPLFKRFTTYSLDLRPEAIQFRDMKTGKSVSFLRQCSRPNSNHRRFHESTSSIHAA